MTTAIARFLPTATLRLIAINCVVYAVTALLGLGGIDCTRWLALPVSPADLAMAPWTPLSYMFTQFLALHLLINMLWLLMFGRLLEEAAGGRAVWSVYIAGGLGGALFYLAGCLTFGSEAPLCGASSSAIAIMAAAGITAPSLPVRLIFFRTVRLKWVVGAGMVLMFITAGGAGFFAHLGGAAAGTVWALIARRRAATTTTKKEKPAGGSKAATTIHRLRVSPQRVKRVREAMADYRADTALLDTLLDKIRVSGFESLSPEEQATLRALSARLNRQT